ncbi:MAG: metallophosphoesterase [Chitinophagaceae bacterium]|nr:metallophosphoesterase [Chitinophagaceae bacterium]
MNLRGLLISGVLCLLFIFEATSQITLIPYGSSWKYLDNGSNQGTAWRASGFNDASWASGNGELGYGDGDETTTVSYGGNASNKYITTYFRTTVNIANPASFSNFTFSVVRDDGFVVYVNGVEVGRDNIGTGTVSYNTVAPSAIEDATITFNVATSAFSAGTNTIAVEMHQASVSSTDVSFDLQLVGNDAFSSTLTRGPYLQMGGQNSITIRWRTSTSQNSRVELGTTFGTYPTVVSDASSVTEHVVNVTGLSADTKYYYRIGNSSNMGAADNEKFFTTLPPANTTRKIRIAAFGDCGRDQSGFQSLTLLHYRNYLTSNGIEAPDAWLLLGDNAYDAGTDAEYTSNFFGVYGGSILKNHKVYPSPGNHDYANNSTRQNDHAVPYYDVFTMPTAGQLGGVSSGNEAFYSFDIGDIHFISLDAYGRESSTTRIYDTTGAQVTWVKADLAANTKKWTVAFWHHPPYTKGSHDSDTETELINIRERFIRILERNGVDLILNGHSHDYERSYLLNQYFKATPAGANLSEVDFNAALHTASQSSGKYDNSANSCPYVYNSGKFNHGTVYVVAGSSGADGGVQSGYPHNAFPFSQDDGGMLYFEVDNNRLDAKFIRRDGNIADKFTILKDVNKSTTVNTTVGSPVTLNASWPGNYSWNTAATTSSINVTPVAVGSTNYTVTDNFGCVTDNFTVVAAATVPVKLVEFTVKQIAGGASLKWITTEESRNKQFNIERSDDGMSFSFLGSVPAKEAPQAENNYSYIDAHPLQGATFYRLIQEDIDGRKEVLGTKKLVIQQPNGLALNVISASERNVTLKISSGQESNVSLRILSRDGKIVTRKNFNKLIGLVSEQISVLPGTYFCEIQNQKGEKIVKQVIVY